MKCNAYAYAYEYYGLIKTKKIQFMDETLVCLVSSTLLRYTKGAFV